MSANITWYIKRDTTFYPEEEYFAGTYSSKTPLSLTIQLWNNRYGTEAVDDLSDFALQASFEHLEDKSLLQYAKLYSGEVELATQILDDHVIYTLPSGTVLKGTVNNGLASENATNYIELSFKFEVEEEANLKENDLKSLYFEIVNL